MNEIDVQFKLETKGTLDKIVISIGGVVLPFSNGATGTVTISLLEDAEYIVDAFLIGQPGGSIKLTADKTEPKTLFTHVQTKIGAGKISRKTFSRFET